jgi:tetratricopeptide (TPR) repeat protein
MKGLVKWIGFIAIIAVILFSMVACASEPIVFDKSLPYNDMAIINWMGVDIIEYNGVSVDWKRAPWGGNLVIKIPGGITHFVMNGTISTNTEHTSYRNIPFTYNFEKGKSYWVRFVGEYIIISNRSSLMEKDVIAKFYMRNGQRAVDLNPEHLSMYANRAQIYAKLAVSQDTETNRAELLLRLEEINAAIVLDPKTFQNYLERANVYYELRDYEKAVEDYNYLLAHDPAKRDYYYYERANVFKTMKKYPEALGDVNKAIEYNPNDGRYYSVRGYCCIFQDMYQEAVIAYTIAIELGSIDEYGNYFYRGEAYRKLEKYQEALDDFTRALAKKPGDFDSLFHRSSVYLALPKPEPYKAIDDINMALVLRIVPPDKLDKLYMNRGIANHQTGIYRRALADMTRAIGLNPREASYLVNRAVLYEEMAKEALRGSVKNEYLNRAKRDRDAAERIRNVGNE